MIAFLTLLYVGVLFILTKLKLLPNKPATWMSTIVWVLVLFIGLFIPMQWGAPAGVARIMTYSVQIIPNVSGIVTEVVAEPNVPLEEGDVLFRIDPTTYRAAVDATRAQLKFQELRLEQFKQLASSAAGTRFQVEETEARVIQLKAELDAAEWNLGETTVRAPSDGFVTNFALRAGQRVTNLPLQPAATFIETSNAIIVAQVNQIYLRYIKVGQQVEIAFKTRPGKIYTGKIQALIRVSSQGQAVISGTIPVPQQVQAEPFFLRIDLDEGYDPVFLPAGTVGTAAIYTQSVTPTHIIRQVMIRMESILNYINPWL